MVLPQVGLRQASSGVAGVLDVLKSRHSSVFDEKVMTEKEWNLHRQAAHRHRLRPGQFTCFMLGYAGTLFWVALLSAAVGVYDIMLVQTRGWPMLTIQCVQTFFGAITFALTMLLVFRTNASYARWNDARRALGVLTSNAHNLGRQAVMFTPPEQAYLASAMVRWSAASMWAVKALVRPAAPLHLELKNVLLPSELSWLLSQPHKPLAVSQALSAIVPVIDMDVELKARLDMTISTYVYECGGCNRIYNTAIPVTYTRHTSRFLLCYVLLGLPLLMWPLANWGAPLLSVMIASLVLGIEYISAFIEEPFKVLAFDAFCQAVTRDMQTLMTMLDHSRDPQFGKPPLFNGTTAPPVVAGITGPHILPQGGARCDPPSPSDAELGSHTPPPSAETPPGVAGMLAKGRDAHTATARSAARPVPAARRAAFYDMAQLPMAPSTGEPQEGSPRDVLSPSPSPPLGVPTPDSLIMRDLQELQQQQGLSRSGSFRHSLDSSVGGGNSHRRPLQAVNSRTCLLSMGYRSSSCCSIADHK